MKCPICQQTDRFAMRVWNLEEGVEMFYQGDSATWEPTYTHHSGFLPDKPVTCSVRSCGHEGTYEEFGFDEDEFPYELKALPDVPGGRRGKAFLDELLAAFPGFKTDEDVNGGDLVEWIGQRLKGEKSAKRNQS